MITVVAGITAAYFGWRDLWTGGAALPEEKQIAVLPLDTAGQDENLRALADGLVETITTKLTQIEVLGQADGGASQRNPQPQDHQRGGGTAVAQEAWDYAKKHRTEIARRLTDPADFIPKPIRYRSSWQARRARRGKRKPRCAVEAQRCRRREDFAHRPGRAPKTLPGYDGANSWLFQRAVTPIVERVHDRP